MTKHLQVCERCGSNEHVHEALCRRCRKVLLGEGTFLPPAPVEEAHDATPEPLRSPPWRRRGA